MKFHIIRTSDWEGKRSPCENAIKGEYIYVDERTVDDPKKLRHLWYKYGNNHRLDIEKGHIKRDFIKEGWILEIQSLQELLEFIQKYGEIILSSTDYQPKIEIYDSNRE